MACQEVPNRAYNIFDDVLGAQPHSLSVRGRQSRCYLKPHYYSGLNMRNVCADLQVHDAPALCAEFCTRVWVQVEEGTSHVTK